MGVVYRATDLLQKQSVALKFMHHYLDNRNTAFTRFQREFRTLAKLDHPNIVRTFGFGAHEGAPYLVLEYLEGHTLGDELASDRPFREINCWIFPAKFA